PSKAAMLNPDRPAPAALASNHRTQASIAQSRPERAESSDRLLYLASRSSNSSTTSLWMSSSSRRSIQTRSGIAAVPVCHRRITKLETFDVVPFQVAKMGRRGDTYVAEEQSRSHRSFALNEGGPLVSVGIRLSDLLRFKSPFILFARAGLRSPRRV